MRTKTIVAVLAAVLFLSVCAVAHAQDSKEFSALGGIIWRGNENSRTLELEYSQMMQNLRPFGFSVAYLNEGHFEGANNDDKHHRDGFNSPSKTSVLSEASSGKNEITMLLGETVVNNIDTKRPLAKNIEYRRTLWKHIDWTGSYLDEGKSGLIDRRGGAVELWAMQRFFDGRMDMWASAPAHTPHSTQCAITHSDSMG